MKNIKYKIKYTLMSISDFFTSFTDAPPINQEAWDEFEKKHQLELDKQELAKKKKLESRNEPSSS